MGQRGLQARHCRGTVAQPGGKPVGEAFAALVQALAHLLEQALRVRQSAAETFHLGAPFVQHAPGTGQETPVQIAQLRRQLPADRDRHFRRCRRGGRTAVAGVIDQGGVGLVADRGNQGDTAGRRGPHHDLFVEGPEVLDGAAAARHDQEVGAARRDPPPASG